MKRLYLLRHAEALSTAQDDKSRHLNDNGKAQAQDLQAIMKERGYVPELIACSTALRTQQTLEIICPGASADFPEDFYNAAPGDLMDYIQKADNAKKSILVVNHNPTIHKLAFMLAGDGNENDLQSLSMGYQPCTLSVLDCPVERWADLSFRANTLTELIPPQR